MYILFVDSCFQGTQQAYSNPNLSQTAQNPARFFENNIFAHLLIAVPGYMRKNVKPCLLIKRRVTSKSVGKRICNVLCAVTRDPLSNTL